MHENSQWYTFVDWSSSKQSSRDDGSDWQNRRVPETEGPHQPQLRAGLRALPRRGAVLILSSIIHSPETRYQHLDLKPRPRQRVLFLGTIPSSFTTLNNLALIFITQPFRFPLPCCWSGPTTSAASSDILFGKEDDDSRNRGFP